MRPFEPGAPLEKSGPYTVESVGAHGDPHGDPAGDLPGPPDLPGPTGLVRFHFFIPRHAVSYTRFILEGYDHLGVQTSAPGSSHVTWTVPAALRSDAEQLLSELLNKLR